MANAYHVVVGDNVPYLTTSARWRSAKVTGVVSQTSLNLAYVASDGTRVAINGGAAVAKRSAPPTGDSETNVWRPY